MASSKKTKERVYRFTLDETDLAVVLLAAERSRSYLLDRLVEMKRNMSAVIRTVEILDGALERINAQMVEAGAGTMLEKARQKLDEHPAARSGG